MHDPSSEQRYRAERIGMLARQTRSGTRSALAATVVLGMMIVPAVGWLPYGLWACAMVVSYLLRDRFVDDIVRRGAVGETDETRIAMSTAALAGVVAFPGIAYLPQMDADIRGLYTGVQVAWVATAALVLGLHARGYLLYVIVSFALLALGWWRVGPVSTAATVSLLLALASLVLTHFAQRLSALFHESIRIRHENEALVARLTESLAQTAQAQKARSRFLAAASHDLLQPVHALMLLVGVLRDGASDAAREQASRRIELTTAAIASMFRGLLDQARLDAGVVTARPEQVSLAAVCRGIEAAYAAQCAEKGLALEIDCPADALAWADAALLDRALRNLVDNAVKFTERGRVAIRVVTTPRQVVVQVEDSGPGIDAADQPRVFEAFYRGSGAHEAGVDGVGLGLAVAAQMLELMDGSIGLHSAPGQGTRMEVRLPRAAAAAAEGAGGAAAPPRRLRYQRVLVVEDDRHAREALLLWLADHGCDVACAASLEEALAICSQRAFEPDFVLSDMRLTPGPDGLATIAALRGRFAGVPAALVTGEAIDDDAVPPDIGLLRKPVRPAQLESLLQGRVTEGS